MCFCFSAACEKIHYSDAESAAEKHTHLLTSPCWKWHNKERPRPHCRRKPHVYHTRTRLSSVILGDYRCNWISNWFFPASAVVTLHHLKRPNPFTPFSVGELAWHSLTAAAAHRCRCRTSGPPVNINTRAQPDRWRQRWITLMDAGSRSVTLTHVIRTPPHTRTHIHTGANLLQWTSHIQSSTYCCVVFPPSSILCSPGFALSSHFIRCIYKKLDPTAVSFMTGV